MKKQLLILLMASLCLGVSAQTVIFNEPFDGMSGYTITYWRYQFTGAVPWQCGLPYQISGGCMLPLGGAMSVNTGTNKIAGIAECGRMDFNNSNVLTYTPPINLSSYSGTWLKYDSYYEQYVRGSDTEKATVEISLDSGSTWTVLEHVAPNHAFLHFQTHYINLAAYDHASNIRIGFRYSDGGGAFMQGWAIDNVCVFKPAQHDIALISTTPNDTLLSYVQTGRAYNHQVQVYNAGLDTIHAFKLSYKLGSTGTVQTDNITGVNVPPFATATIAHSIPDTVPTMGTFQVSMWATLDSDAFHGNDTVFSSLRGAQFIPGKVLAIEEGEGTYNGWSPRNMYYLKSVPALDIDPTLISVHEHDPMEDRTYHDFMEYSYWLFVPYFSFDRRLSVPVDSFFDFVDRKKNSFGFADVSINGDISGNTVTVTGQVNPAIDLRGDYRIALVITEDGVRGSGSGYDQVNYYSGGAYGVMDGYESKPNPVPAADMTYDHVARLIYPAPDGMPASLPATMTAGNTYNYSLTTTIDTSWTHGKLKANVLLIRHSDTVILNSNHMRFYLSTTHVKPPFHDAGIYPNPTTETAQLYFDVTHAEAIRISVTDLSGRPMYAHPASNYYPGRNTVSIPVSQLPTGMYLINLWCEDGNKSLKLEVIH